MEYTINNTLTQAWEYWYKKLSSQERTDSSRDGEVCGEIINAVTVITDPTQNILKSNIRNLPMRYAVGELLWYLSSSNKLDAIKRYSKAWENLSDDGETVNSAYGYRISQKFGFNQWDYCYDKLRKDPNSRQAVIHIKDADNTPTKDTPCTVCLQFLLRDNKLGLTVYMRSNDIWLGFPYDVFSFTCLQIMMANELGVDVGEYTHIAGSLHLYSRNKV